MARHHHQNTRTHHGHSHSNDARHHRESHRYENIRNDHRAHHNDYYNTERDHSRRHDRGSRGYYGRPDHQFDLESRSGRDTHSEECLAQFPSATTTKTKRRICLGLIYVGILAAVAFQVCILVFQIMVITKRAVAVDDSTAEFALYKNSLFEGCSANTTSQPDCTLLDVDLTHSSFTWSWIEDHRTESLDEYFMSRSAYDVSSGSTTRPKASYSWCELASCLENFKVVPSTPRDSAYGFTGLKAWSSLLTTAIFVFLDLRKMFSDAEKCDGIGSRSWLELLPKAVSVGWWWYGFGLLLHDPDGAPPISLDSWIVMWNLSASLDFHPWRCRKPQSKPRRAISLALQVFTFVQVCATIHAFRIQDRTVFQRYDCLQSEINAAPGSSSCTPEELCSNSWLFSNPNLLSNTDETAIMFYKITWIISLVGYFFTVLWLVFKTITGPAYWTPERMKAWFGDEVDRMSTIMRLGASGFIGYMGMCYAIVIFVSPEFKFTFDAPGGPATVAYDFNCTAAHIGVSPRYYYLDVGYGRDMRIAKMWLNA